MFASFFSNEVKLVGGEIMGQYFVKKDIHNIFIKDLVPKLLYICNVDDTHTKLPRTMHMHDDVLEIIFVKEGKGTQLIDGRHYQTGKGDLLIYNNGVLHDEYGSSETNLSVFCCGITDVELAGLPRNHLVSNFQSYVLNSGEHAPDIQSLLEMMHSQVAEGKSGAEEICSYLVQALIIRILQIPQKNFTLPTTEESNLLNEIKSYIDLHYFEEINLKLLSEKFHISSYHMVHSFKKFTGFSPIQYMIRRRIGEAQSLLINTNESITKIAGIVGYDNISYFTTLFSKTVGMSPKKYRHLWSEKIK